MKAIEIQLVRVSDTYPNPEPPPPPEPPDPTRRYFRVLHDKELFDKGIIDRRNGDGVWYWRRGFPEVFNFENSHVTRMTRWVQELCWDLMLYANPNANSGEGGYRSLYDIRRAFTNKTGFDTVHDPDSPDYQARIDYINRIDLGGELPRFDKSRVCGGATLSGEVSGKYLIPEILIQPPAATREAILQYVLARPWLYFHATTVAKSSPDDRQIVGKFPQNGGAPCYVPLVMSQPVSYPLDWLEEVDGIADPYAV